MSGPESATSSAWSSMDLRTLLDTAALDPSETESWIMSLPVATDAHELDATARGLLRELWGLLIGDLAAGVVVSVVESHRVITIANTIEFHVDADEQRIDACVTHPKYAARWFAFDVSNPLPDLFWADRMTERHSALRDRLDDQLRECPVDSLCGDTSVAAGIYSSRVWLWAMRAATQRLRGAFNPVPLRENVLSSFHLSHVPD